MGEDALKFPGLLIAAAAVSCTSCQARQLTVEEAVKRIDELNGQTVAVAGYLADCFGYECVLYVNKKEADQATAWWKQVRRGQMRREMSGPLVGKYALGIGSGEYVCPDGHKNGPKCYFAFDKQAAPFRHGYVIITGKLTNECRHDGEFGCLDRTTDLEPTAIRPWKRIEQNG
jgi:hypothetical protein